VLNEVKMKKSKLMEKLRNKECIVGLGVGLAATPRIPEIIGMLGYDWVWVDMEHKPFDHDDVYNLITGARAAGIECIVRVRRESYASYFRAFEDGAAGIMVPHCKSAAEAREVVHHGKYPPIGMRGIDGAGVDADFGMAPQAAHIAGANNESFIMLQIEDKEALDDIEAIASTKGVGALFVGPGDLRKSLGLLNDPQSDKYWEAVKTVALAAKKNGIWWGTSSGATDEVNRYAEMGAQIFAVGSDRGMLIGAAKAQLEKFTFLRS
jgi:4-hydroxy-2-oxoheptanedioate aldolase